jgi:hypothetical protein
LEQEVLFKGIRDQVMWPRQRTLFGKMKSSLEPVPMGIFVRQDYDEANDVGSKYSHGIWMPRVQKAVFALCLVTMVLTVLLGLGVLHHTAEQQSTSPPAKITVTVEQHP